MTETKVVRVGALVGASAEIITSFIDKNLNDLPDVSTFSFSDKIITNKIADGKNVSVPYQRLYEKVKQNLDPFYRTIAQSYTKEEVDAITSAGIRSISPADADDELPGLKFPVSSGTYANYGNTAVDLSEGFNIIFSKGDGTFSKTVIPLDLSEYLTRKPLVTREKLVYQFPEGLPDFTYTPAAKTVTWEGRTWIVNGKSNSSGGVNRVIIGQSATNTIDFSDIIAQDPGRFSYTAYVTLPDNFINAVDFLTYTINPIEIKFVSDRVSGPAGEFDPAILREDSTLILFQLDTVTNTLKSFLDGHRLFDVDQRVKDIKLYIDEDSVSKDYLLSDQTGIINITWLNGFYSSATTNLGNSLSTGAAQSSAPFTAIFGAEFTIFTSPDAFASGSIGKFVDSDGLFLKNLVLADLTEVSANKYTITIDHPSCVEMILTVYSEYIPSLRVEGFVRRIDPEFINLEVPTSMDLLENETAVNIAASYFPQADQQKLFRKAGLRRINKKMTCILVAGQSNTDGRAAQADAPVWLSSNSFQLDNMLVYSRVGGKFDPFKLGVNTGAEDNADTRFAYDLFVAKNFIDAYGDPIYVIKCSLGATSIDQSVSSAPGYWDPYDDDFAGGKRKLLEEFTARFYNALTYAGKFDIDIQVKACLWHQGETDNNTTTAANNYLDNFRNVITYVRGMAGNPVLPFIYGNIPNASNAYNATIRAAQEQVATEDINAHLVDISDLTLFDGLHLNAANQETFGNRIWTILQDILQP